MNIDITALDLLPETNPTATTGMAEEGLARCMITCWITCWDTCNNTEIFH
jgi:hypothetical protein